MTLNGAENQTKTIPDFPWQAFLGFDYFPIYYLLLIAIPDT